MSNDQFNEDGGVDLNDDTDLDMPAASPAKKSNLPLMAGAGVALAVVVGFAGFQIYNKFLGGAPAPDMGYGAPAPMQPPAPMANGQMGGNGMQGGPAAGVNINAPLQGGAMPVVPPAPGAAPGAMPGVPAAVGAPAAAGQPPVVGGVDVAGKPVDGVLAAPGGSVAPVAGAVGAMGAAPGMSAAPAPASAVKGPVDVAAIEELKKQTMANAERIDSVEARLKSLEERLAKFEGKKPTKAAKSEAVIDERASRADTHAERPTERLNKGAKALKNKLKGSQAAKKSDWKKAPAESRSRTEDAVEAPVAPKKNPADIVLPPAPVFNPGAAQKPAVDPAKAAEASKPASAVKPVAPTSAEALPVIRPSMGDIKVQAVIPGRVWLSEAGGPTRSFAVGDVIKSGVVIRSIDADTAQVHTTAGVLK